MCYSYYVLSLFFLSINWSNEASAWRDIDINWYEVVQPNIQYTHVIIFTRPKCLITCTFFNNRDTGPRNFVIFNHIYLSHFKCWLHYRLGEVTPRGIVLGTDFITKEDYTQHPSSAYRFHIVVRQTFDIWLLET